VKAPRVGAEAPSGEATRVYKAEMPRGWWLRQRHYFLYMVREFTAVPMALWLLWLLFDIQRAGNGPKAFYASSSPAFIAFSVICLGFALYHSITFLSLAGAQTKPLPPGPMQAKVKASCTQCHNAARITEQHLTRQEWSTELDKMVALGAEVPDSDRAALLSYLTKNFGPEKSGKSGVKKSVSQTQ